MEGVRNVVSAMVTLIVLLTVVAYLPVRNAGFVFDDYKNVTGNPSLRTLSGLGRIWTDPSASYQYYPLTYTSFWIEYHLWGLRPIGYHAVNVLLHALNAVLVGLLLSRLAVPGAWFAALLFALHPVHVESVAWVSERKNVLSALFYLSSLLAYLRFEENSKRRRGLYALAFALFVCALLSKTSAVSLPFAVLLVLWWKRGRVERRDVIALIPFVLVGAALGLLTAWVEVRYSGARGPDWELSWLERCLVAGRVVWFYAGKLIWPDPLMVIYPRWQIDPGLWWQYLFPSAAVAVVLALWRWRGWLGKGPLVAAVFFVGTLAPVPAFINVAFMRYSYVANHWQYLSSIGLIALATATGERVWSRIGQRRRYLGAVAGVVVLAALAAAAWKWAGVYVNEEALWRDNVSKDPNVWAAHNHLGFALQSGGKLGDAIGQYEQALCLKPDYAEAHYNLGVALQQAGKLGDAIDHYEQAVRLRPEFAEAHNNLGDVLIQLGRFPEAMQHLEQALRIDPDYAEARYNLGNALRGVGNPTEAIRQYEQALGIRLDYVEAHNNLGIALAEVGRLPEAIRHWEQALRMKADYAEVHKNLGNALIRLGKMTEAAVHYEQIVRLKPDSAEAANNLAWLLATLPVAEGGDPVRAVTLAERASELTGNRSAAYLDTLAAAYAATGRFGDAVATAQSAIELASAVGQLELAREIGSRLEIYRSGGVCRRP
jgi:tetratricopeptide (TPR) repeat protein